VGVVLEVGFTLGPLAVVAADLVIGDAPLGILFHKCIDDFLFIGRLRDDFELSDVFAV
jgi:hypothetical protein